MFLNYKIDVNRSYSGALICVYKFSTVNAILFYNLCCGCAVLYISREQSTAVADCIRAQSIERQNAEIKGGIFGRNNSEIILS